MPSWTRIAAGLTKVDLGLRKLTPPEPDDEFENLKRDIYPQLDKLVSYTSGKVEDEE